MDYMPPSWGLGELFLDSIRSQSLLITSELSSQRGEAVDPSVVLSSQRSILSAGVLPWSRSRVMVVGQGRVGKSSFIRRLLGRGFDPNERSTSGAVTEDVDAKNVRELEGVDIEQAEIGNLWNTVKDEAGLEHVRLLRQEVARKAKIDSSNHLMASLKLSDAEVEEAAADDNERCNVRDAPNAALKERKGMLFVKGGGQAKDLDFGLFRPWSQGHFSLLFDSRTLSYQIDEGGVKGGLSLVTGRRRSPPPLSTTKSC